MGFMELGDVFFQLAVQSERTIFFFFFFKFFTLTSYPDHRLERR